MRRLRATWQRLLATLVRRSPTDFDDELESHIQLHTDDNIRSGMTPADARRRALLALGGVARTKECYCDRRGIPVLDWVWRDLLFAARLLVKDRWFTLTAVLTLALGLAITNTVFTIVNAMFLRGLPVEHPDRIITFVNYADQTVSVSYRDLLDFRENLSTLAGVAGLGSTNMTVRDADLAPESFSGSYISANTFQLLDIRPILGRDFSPDDDRPGAAPVVLLGSTIWKNRYGADGRVVGRTVTINGVPSTVIGVMPEGVRFPLFDELWQPLAMMPNMILERRSARTLRGFGRLADGRTLQDGRAEIAALASRLAQEHPDTNKDFRMSVAPFTGVANTLFVALFAAAGFVLLIACANVANLLLARSSQRSREVSVRVSLGATRTRIVAQLLVESAVLALLAGAIGLAFSAAAVRLYAWSIEGINFPYWYRDRWTMDVRVFMVFAAVCLSTVFVFGLAPAIDLSRANVHELVKDGSRTSPSHRARRWTTVLLAGEVTLTLVLLSGATLMFRSFLAIYRADRVIDASQFLSTSLTLPVARYRTPAEQLAFFERLQERLNTVAAIPAATHANRVPFIGAPTRQLTIDGQAPRSGLPAVTYITTGDNYFKTLGLSLLKGRGFTNVDGTPGHEAAIVNQRLVSLFFPDVDPIGRRILLMNTAATNNPALRSETATAPRWLTIVGVSPTVRQQFLQEIDPVVYVPERSDPFPFTWLLVRASSEPARLMPLLRAELAALDPDLPLGAAYLLEDAMTQSRWGHRVFGMMLGIFAVAALLLALVGLYAVTAYAVVQRTHEVGVRMAVGAHPAAIVRLFLKRMTLPVGAGLVLGLAGAYGIGRVLRGLLVQTAASDPIALTGMAGLLIGVAIVATALPARRAARLDPVNALRYE